jgi:hypothetical protein
MDWGTEKRLEFNDSRLFVLGALADGRRADNAG